MIVASHSRWNKLRLLLLNNAGLAHEYKACNIGVGGDELKREYKPELGLEEATMLAVKAALREKKKPENVLVATVDAKLERSEFS